MPDTRLAHVRKQRRLTQQALADLVGVHRVTIARLEAGAEPGVTLALQLADVLSVDVEDLWAWKRKRKRKHESQLVDWLPDMLPGASPEGAFRQEVLSWCSQERSIDGMLDNTGIVLVPKSSDDREALLDALAAIHETATRLERQLTSENGSAPASPPATPEALLDV